MSAVPKSPSDGPNAIVWSAQRSCVTAVVRNPRTAVVRILLAAVEEKARICYYFVVLTVNLTLFYEI